MYDSENIDKKYVRLSIQYQITENIIKKNSTRGFLKVTIISVKF